MSTKELYFLYLLSALYLYSFFDTESCVVGEESPITTGGVVIPSNCQTRWFVLRNSIPPNACTLTHYQITCVNPKCKFSSTHPLDCLPPQCRQTCWQYRQYPEQYNPQIDGVCPTCAHK
ncbi:hypothetical protein PNOK_0043800 [Pyrrhoderma noxium]|uniref:Uncharacterized protein n=1 Tax=Pyrrhoderma noxium TaxID=2282107 RepID=A0A286UUT5_9AGAM|nr:hypothetical protein PNOK_0043800 [Pyrrhoderma noxium]